jgi:hypothetical protein
MKNTHRFSWFVGIAVSAMVAIGGIAGCEDDDLGTVGTAADCDDVCARYRTCFDGSFDVASCTSQCQTRLGNATIQSTDVDDCMDCLGDNTCTPVYSCADACDTIIIVQ